MDFAEVLCQNTSASPISNRTSPAHNNPINADPAKHHAGQVIGMLGKEDETQHDTN
jgi:hypothetical protein